MIKMVTPHTLDELHIGDTISITGDAMSTLFTGYSLSWEKDYVKDSIGQYGPIEYDSVVGAEFDTNSPQILNGTLGTLDTHGFDTGTYTIIFAVGSSDNRSTQERCNIYMTKAPPKFVAFSVDSIWVNTGRGLLIQATTDIPAQLDVRYTTLGGNSSTIADDIVGFEHAILIPPGQAQAGVPLSIEAMLVTPNGDTTARNAVAMIPNEAVVEFPQGEFIQKSYTLPPGFALDSVLAVPEGNEVIENPIASGILTVYKFDSTNLSIRSSRFRRRSLDAASHWEFSGRWRVRNCWYKPRIPVERFRSAVSRESISKTPIIQFLEILYSRTIRLMGARLLH